MLTAYQKLGVVHLLAISGLHVGILTAGLFYIMIRLGITREKASILLLLFLPLYVMLTGAAPSVLRAALMSGVYLAGSLVKWRVHSATAICLSYIVLLLFNPYHLFEAGFQLSFAVSFSLILSSSIFHQVKTSLGAADNCITHRSAGLASDSPISFSSVFYHQRTDEYVDGTILYLLYFAGSCSRCSSIKSFRFVWEIVFQLV